MTPKALLITCFSACSALALASPGQGAFCPATDSLWTGPNQRPNAAACGDMNGDGLVDIVTANDLTDTLSVILAGFPGGPQFWKVGDEPVALQVADIDLDGDLDIVTANHTSHDVSVLLNDRGNGFNSSTPISVGQAPIDIVAAHLNPDQAIDIVVANAADGTIAVLVNLGGGVFAAPVAYASGNTPNSLGVCDIDRDGDTDIVVGSIGESSVSVFDNHGGATFAPPRKFLVTGNLFDLACCEVDGVNGPDVVTVDGLADDITVLLNNGSGQLSVDASYPGANGGFSLHCGDVDCDGQMDIVTANLVSDDLTIFHNVGGTFHSTTSVPIGQNPSSVICSNLFGNAAPEIVTTIIGGVKTVTNTCSSCSPTSVRDPIPRDGFQVAPPFPNPFRLSTRLAFSLGDRAQVEVEFFDVAGRSVRKLVSGLLPRGEHAVTWDGRGHSGEFLPSGIYLYRLTVDGRVATGRLAILR